MEAVQTKVAAAAMRKYYTEEGWQRRRRYYEEGPADEWRALWTQLARHLGAPPPPPPVDFAREMVVFAAMGTRPSGGFGIEIGRAAPAGGAFEVVVTEHSPGTDCSTPAMITEPAAAVQVPRSDLPVRWIERGAVHPCE